MTRPIRARCAAGPAESRLRELEEEFKRLTREERAAEQALSRLQESRERLLKFARDAIGAARKGTRSGVEASRAAMEMAWKRVQVVDEKVCVRARVCACACTRARPPVAHTRHS